MADRRAMTAVAFTGVERVLVKARSFDERDMLLIHRRYFDPLSRYATAQGASDPEGAANLALFDACRAHARRPITEEIAFRSYLYRAARSHTLNQLRRPQPATTAVDEHHVVEIQCDDEVVNRYWIGDLLDQLPDDQRTVLDLRVVHGLSADEAGAVLNRSPNAVYQLQHRAKNELRRLVLERGQTRVPAHDRGSSDRPIVVGRAGVSAGGRAR